MESYIKKADIIAEINRIKKEECPTDSYEGRCKLLWFEQFLSFINTLEVKEVDLDEEFDKYCENLYLIDLENEPYAELFECAKHFFELGLNAQRKIGYVPNIDDSLKELGVDPSSKEAKIFKESYCAALDKFMAQKGE